MTEQDYSDCSEADRMEDQIVSGMKETPENQESQDSVFVQDQSQSQSQSQSSISSSASLDNLDKYQYKKGAPVPEPLQKSKRGRSSQPIKPAEAKEEKAEKQKKSKPKKKTSKKKKGQLSQGQKLIAENQCKQIFQRLINTMDRRNCIDQTSLRNALERFTGKCDLEKLIPLMNVLEPEKQPPRDILTFQEFRLIFMHIQYDI